MRKILVAVLLVLLRAESGWATIALVNTFNASLAQGNPRTVGPVSLTAGNTLIVGIDWLNATTTVTSITDNSSPANTYVHVPGTPVQANTMSCDIWYVKNIQQTASITLTVNFSDGTQSTNEYLLHQYSGTDTTGPFDSTAGVKNSTGTSGSNTGGTATSSSLTPTNANEVLVAFLALNGSSGTPTTLLDTNFTFRIGSGVSQDSLSADWIQTTATASTDGFKTHFSRTWIQLLTAWKPPSGGAAACANFIALMGAGCK